MSLNMEDYKNLLNVSMNINITDLSVIKQKHYS